jgi:N-methylhydantoinase A
MSCRLGADIGGTFTDVVLVDDAGGTFRIGKVLTTSDAPEEGVIEGACKVLKEAAVDPSAVATVIHGTTLFANALIERRGARTALITTKGFRDAIEIGREHRYDMYDLYIEKPKPLAPRHLRFEVDERILADGSVVKPLEDADVQRVVDKLASEQVEAVGVCLLHSYVDDLHERRIGELLDRLLPEVARTLSCEIVPELREYDRASTTLVNVYVKRLAERYMRRLAAGLLEAGIRGDLFVMQSNGGLCDVETASTYPVRLIESGPAAGALAAAHYGKLLGHANLLSFDMGGTTAKACVIAEGEPSIVPEVEVDRRYRFAKGSGLPVKMPVVDMIEIGTGGGSIARVDALGRLLVGPDSAGAKPGPAAYGLGGTEPTVTDADLVLGYLDPAFFLGGEMALDLAAARRAVRDRVAEPLGLPLQEAAYGIHQLANESMASAARIHAIERGKDVGRLPIFAFGGAGPVHAWGVAGILGSPSVIYPFGAGVMSAVGFLVAPMSFDFVRTLPGTLDEMDWTAVGAVLEEMENAGRAILGRSIDPAKVGFRRSADMRYRKQGYEIRVGIPDGRLGPERAGEVRAAFEKAYADLYGHTIANTPIDVVSWRVVAQGPKPELASFGGTRGGGVVRKGTRAVWLPDARAFAEIPVYDRYALRPAATLKGPAIVEERESTVVVGPGVRLTVDEQRNLVAERA